MQLDFYLSKEDKMELVALLFSKGATLIPSLHYPSEEYIELHSLKAYEEHVDKNRLMHIVHPSFSNMKLEFDSFEKEGKKVFYILQRYGGPTIDFYSPGNIVKKGVEFIGPGFVSIYSYYWKIKEKLPASDELKSFYRDLIDFIKNRSTPIKYAKRIYYVGFGANQAILRGYKLANITDEALSSLILDISDSDRQN